jgi:hypothetical protein
MEVKVLLFFKRGQILQLCGLRREEVNTVIATSTPLV